MKTILLVSLFIFIWSCSTKPKQIQTTKKIKPTINLYTQQHATQDSINENDTNTLIGKRNFIFQTFLKSYPCTEFDSLIDINYDGNLDYIIGFYSLNGTGFKNRIKVYLYNQITKSYIANKELSKLRNPTFYIKKKKITEFYIGNGGGNGKELIWKKNQWVTNKEFTVRNNDSLTTWEVQYKFVDLIEVSKQAFQMIPPKNILETNVK
ncbi:MAG: hypothetical protein HYR91_03560 [Flavobacteriia bacterium]|nr:hypothetical protein [Flavobacteriia bacterium]